MPATVSALPELMPRELLTWHGADRSHQQDMG